MPDVNTTAGKGIKTLLWIVVANVVIYVLSAIIGNPGLFNPYIVGAANLILVLAKNFADPNVKNI